MRVVIAGGGLVGLGLARLLAGRGVPSTVVERRPAGTVVRRGFMLGHHGDEAVAEAGLDGVLAAEGRPIGAGAGGAAAARAIDMGRLLTLLEEGAEVRWGRSVTALRRDGAGRVCGVVVGDGDGAETEVGCDLVVACDGARSRVRAMAGIAPEVTPLEEGKIEWMSPRPTPETFAMRYLADGGHIGVLSWREGSFGWRTTRRVGREAALAPGLDALADHWCRLLPEAEEGMRALTSIDQIHYDEPELLRCDRWWVPGVVVIGEAAHVFGPETGASAGIGLADAHALAVAIATHRDDPDGACAAYTAWRAPVARGLEAMDPSRARVRGMPLPPGRPDEEWPPGDPARG